MDKEDIITRLQLIIQPYTTNFLNDFSKKRIIGKIKGLILNLEKLLSVIEHYDDGVGL